MWKKNIFIFLLFIFWLSFLSAENQNKQQNDIIKIKVQNNWQTQYITLTEEDIKELEKEKGFLKILESIYKNNKKIFIWIIADKKLQEKLYADPINLNISTRSFYVNSLKNQFFFWTFLEKSEALAFLNLLKEWKPLIITLETDKKIVIFKLKSDNFLKNKKIKYEYLFKLIQNKDWSYQLKEVKFNNTDKPIFKITTETKNYIEKKVKIIPGILWYTSTWQIIIFAVVLVILIWTVIFWYLYKNIRKINV